MASKNLIVNGENYNGIQKLEMEMQDNSTAIYVETSDANADSSEIAKDKIAYVNGIKVVGTFEGGSGGGGNKIYPFTYTTSTGKDNVLYHNLNLSSYIAIWYFDGYAEEKEAGTATMFIPVYGVVGYNAETNFLNEALKTDHPNQASGYYAGFKSNDGIWNTAIVSGNGASSANAIKFGSSYGNFIGTYKGFIIDLTNPVIEA